MKNYEERSGFILRFIEEDVEQLAAHRPGTFQDLQRDIAAIADPPPAPPRRGAGTSPQWTVPILRALQAESRDKIISNIASHNIREMRGQVEEKHGENYLFPPAIRRSPSGENYYFPDGDSHSCVVWTYKHGHFYPYFPSSVHRATIDVSTPANRFLWEVCVTLSKIDASRVRICRPKECDRYFFAEHGNQWYCTLQCANKARNKRYRTPTVV